MTPATHKRNSVGQALCKGKGAPNLTDSTYNVTCKLCLKKIEELTKKTIKKIEDKVNWVGRHNMPTTTEIAEMLEFLHIPFTTAPCPKPPKGRKPGMKLIVLDLTIDPSEYDYSEKNWGYANRLLEIIKPSMGGTKK